SPGSLLRHRARSRARHALEIVVTTRRSILALFDQDERAAAMVEFLFAFIPILILFLCVIELTRLSVADLMVQRAAGIAVRACAVIKDQPLHCDENSDRGLKGQSPNEDADIELAAREALKPLSESTLRVDAAPCTTVHDAAGPDKDVGGHYEPTTVAQSGPDEVKVTARFRCVVPLARDIVCPNVEQRGSPFGSGERTRQ